MQVQSAFHQLDEFCDEHALWLELHTGGTAQGEKGHEWRRLERIDLTSKATRKTVATQLIITTPERAAAELLATLGAEA